MIFGQRTILMMLAPTSTWLVNTATWGNTTKRSQKREKLYALRQI